MLTDLLQHYDFSEKEAKVYLTSLEFGKSPASSLARKSGIKRVTTYALLKEMEKKGFIIHEEVAGIIYFSAVHPETLLRHFQEQSQQFEQALPELLALANSFSDTKGEIKLETHRRDPLHSQGLQEKFPQMYQDFWKGNEHIFSGNSVLTRWGGLGVSGAFNIKQKLPSKMYVGISPLDTFDIQFTTSQEYNSVLEHFEKINITSDSRFLGIKEFLLEFLKKNGYKSGFKISLLVESQQGLGTGYISLAMSLLAVAVYLFTGKLEKKMLRKYDQFLASEVFKEILDFSKKLVDIPTNGNVYGANNYVVFSNTSQPQVYNQIWINPLQLVAKPLSVFVGNEEANKTVNLPFDYGYFFLGSGYNSSMIINMKTNFKKSISTDKKQIVHLFEENGIKKSDLKHLFGELVDGDFYQAFQNIFLILKLKILLAFGKVLDYPNDDEVLSKFIASINTYNQYASVSQEENPLIGLIRERFAKYRYFSDEELGMFPISSWKTGGCFGFVMKYQKSRETLQKVFDTLEKEWHSKISLPYASRIDGTSADGITIEK